MSSTAVLESLGYDQSPNYLDMVKDAVPSSSQFSHVYRKAVKDCGLQGVYIINDNRQNVEDNRRNVEVPVVFYCKAANEEVSRHIHQRVWNQNVAPFVLVETPSTLRLYCGFRFSEEALNDRSRGILKASIAFNEVADSLRSLSANAIDSGSVWEDLGHEITLAALNQKICIEAAAIFIWTAVFYRSKWKYEERAYRYIYLDAGHIAGNLALAATSIGLGTCQIGALFDDEVDDIIGVDGKDESVIYMSLVGHPI